MLRVYFLNELVGLVGFGGFLEIVGRWDLGVFGWRRKVGCWWRICGLCCVFEVVGECRRWGGWC